MKLSSRKRTEKKLELSTTGMIDIVFLLLVFFLVTSTFLPPEKEVRPAISTRKKNSSSSRADFEKAVVEIVAEGGNFLYQLGTLKTTDRKVLLDKLKEFPNKQDGAFVKTVDDAEFDLTAQAISACKEAGFIVVTFVTDSK